MPVADLLKALGYEGSPNFIQGTGLEEVAGYSYVFRRAKSTCHLHGVYTLNEKGQGTAGGTLVPLVYVCEATDTNPAPVIHQRVWNQNVTPFILVETRGNVYLYSGFRYDGPPDKSESTPETGVLRAVENFNKNMRALENFQAEAIDEGAVWREWEPHVTPQTRVDRRLLENLEKLGRWLRENGLKKDPAHALIGKYVFLRYLKDRNILSEKKFEEWGIKPETVFGREATLAGFGRLVKRLDDWLNGSIFPLNLTGKDAPTLEHLQRVAGAFKGDDPIRGQLHLDFQPYDFAHIPVETLSVIYEQFLHAEGKGKASGAYYTPVPLVDFMLQELEDRSPLGTRRRVFDASCGSGTFLVQCYRRMIEQHLRQSGGERPKPSELRELLVKNVYGMDEDEDACRVAELSLILTMLDYIETLDLSRNPNFKIPDLHNRNIFHGNFFAPNCRFSTEEAEKFDWVVGNPPWVELKSDRPEDRAILRWMWLHDKNYPTGGNQAAEAFAWKVADNLTPGGVAALLLPAMTLFKYESKMFRQKFFTTMKVWCIANFANLAEVLFARRSRVPAAAFFYSHRNEGEPLEDILTFAPFVVNQEANRPIEPGTRKDTWNIVVNASEVQNVRATDAMSGDMLIWKAAMWGSGRDLRLLEKVRKRFDSLKDFAKERDIAISLGIQLRKKGQAGAEHVSYLAGKRVLNTKALRGAGTIFSFPPRAVETIPAAHAYIRRRGGMGGLEVIRAPHVIVDETRRFAVYTDEELVITNQVIGIAGQEGQEGILKALSLFLLSDFAKYFQFFNSPGWGVKMEQATLGALQALPVPFARLSDQELHAWEELHRQALAISADYPLYADQNSGTETLQDILRRINELTFSTMGIGRRERWLIEDLVNIRLPLDEGKLDREAVDPPKAKELEKYAGTLELELDSFLDNDSRHEARVVYDSHSAMVEIRLGKGSGPRKKPEVLKADLRTSKEFERSRELLRRKHSQWLYFDRNLIMFEGDLTYLFKPMQRVHWTRSQAAVDADQIISETLTSSGE
jgi:hypothetical protein